jgi:exportin-1
MLPLNTNIREAYSRGQDAEQNFIQNLAMFLCTYLKEHGSLIEQRHIDETLLKVVWTDAFFCSY